MAEEWASKVAALYVAVDKAGSERKVVSEVSPVDEARFYAMWAVISAVLT